MMVQIYLLFPNTLVEKDIKMPLNLNTRIHLILFLIQNQSTNENKFLFYSKFLENVCFADYIDRITFQNQIWVYKLNIILETTICKGISRKQTFTLMSNKSKTTRESVEWRH